jgi:hypothetical protein
VYIYLPSQSLTRDQAGGYHGRVAQAFSVDKGYDCTSSKAENAARIWMLHYAVAQSSSSRSPIENPKSIEWLPFLEVVSFRSCCIVHHEKSPSITVLSSLTDGYSLTASSLWH